MARIHLTPISTSTMTIVEVPSGGAGSVVSDEYPNQTGGALPAYALVSVDANGSLALVDAASQSFSGALGFLTSTVPDGSVGKIQTAGASQFLREAGSPLPGPGEMLYASVTSPGRVTTVPDDTPGNSLVQVGRHVSGKVLINLRLEVALG